MTWKRVIQSQKSRKDGLVGKQPDTAKNPQKTYPKGRVCAQPGCDTRLSMYNPEEYCALHEK